MSIRLKLLIGLRLWNLDFNLLALKALYEELHIVTSAKASRLWWIGHVERVRKDCLTRKIFWENLYKEKAGRDEMRGKSRNRWLNIMEADLIKSSVTNSEHKDLEPGKTKDSFNGYGCYGPPKIIVNNRQCGCGIGISQGFTLPDNASKIIWKVVFSSFSLYPHSTTYIQGFLLKGSYYEDVLLC